MFQNTILSMFIFRKIELQDEAESKRAVRQINGLERQQTSIE